MGRNDDIQQSNQSQRNTQEVAPAENAPAQWNPTPLLDTKQQQQETLSTVPFTAQDERIDAQQPSAAWTEPSTNQWGTASSPTHENLQKFPHLPTADEDDGFEDLGAPKQLSKNAKRKANRAAKAAESKGDAAHEKLHDAKDHLKEHAVFGKRKAAEVAEEARIGANAAVGKASDKIDEWNDQAKATGEHLMQHAKFGERKTGDMVDECKDMAQTAEAKAEQRARVADLNGHHNHAEFESASAHAMFHLREGLEMARKIALDAKNQLVGPPPATGGHAQPLLPEDEAIPSA